MKTYELWDFGSGNRLGEYPDQASALAFVRDDLRLGKANLWRESALLALDEDDNEETIAEGDALIALARGRSGQTPPAAGGGSTLANYKPFGGYDFGGLTAAASIATMGPSIADLMGPRIADMMVPRLAIPTDVFVPRLAIPREVIEPVTSGEMFGTALFGAGLLSFGRVDWGRYFIQDNDRFMQSLTEAARLPLASLSSSVMEEWLQLASEIARLLAESGRRGDDQILALARDPEKRFVHRETGQDDYLGAIDPNSDIERGRIIVFRWWLTRDGRLVG